MPRSPIRVCTQACSPTLVPPRVWLVVWTVQINTGDEDVCLATIEGLGIVATTLPAASLQAFVGRLIAGMKAGGGSHVAATVQAIGAVSRSVRTSLSGRWPLFVAPHLSLALCRWGIASEAKWARSCHCCCQWSACRALMTTPRLTTTSASGA